MCPQAANHCAYFEFEIELKFYTFEACPHVSLSVCRLILIRMHPYIRITGHK